MIDLLKEFTPGATGVWTGVIMFAGWWLREWRETRKLSIEDRLARRDGYAKQVSMLMNENRQLHNDLARMRLEHDNYRKICQTDNDQLRNLINGLNNQINYLRLKLGINNE